MKTAINTNTPSSMSAAIVEAVRRLYESYPYPNYPLLAKPAWQDGYLATSLFAARLARDIFGASAGAASSSANANTNTLMRGSIARTTILLGGSGEILPYIIRRWEPASHKVLCLDVSRRSLRRARLRLFASPKTTQFVREDLHQHLKTRLAQVPTPEPFHHIDAYGVLHHLSDPGATLGLLARSLAPGGTMRIMVYNSPARRWITSLQRAFALLAIDRHQTQDLAVARGLLKALCEHSARYNSKPGTSLNSRVQALGDATVANDARFVDTFLHARETRLPIETWFEHLKSSGLKIVGLLDRYAELDDLFNPLWRPPTVVDLTARALDGRFENNLELHLVKPRIQETMAAAPLPNRHLFPLLLMRPPRLWFSFSETRDIGLPARMSLWRTHLDWVLRGQRTPLDFLAHNLTHRALQRLARIGALLPGQIADQCLRKQLELPMSASMEAPAPAYAASLWGTNVERLIRSRLKQRFNNIDERRLAAVIARMEAAQS